MKLYEIRTLKYPRPSFFVAAESVDKYFTTCEQCGWLLDRKQVSKVLRWQGGPAPLDFASTTVGTFAKQHVADELYRQFSDLTQITAEVVNSPQGPERDARIVYTGETIVELACNLTIPLQPGRATLADKNKFAPCPACGRFVGTLEGVEHVQVSYDDARDVRRFSRKPGKGAFVYEDEIADHNFFYLGPAAALHCTERVRRFIQQAAYSGADLLEIGETVRRGEPIPIDPS